MARCRADDRGTLTISLAIIFPAVLLFILLVVQAAVLWFSDSVALSAAREGLDARRLLGGTDAAAQAQATTVLKRWQGAIAAPTEQSVTVSQPAQGTVTVTVTVHPLFLPPGLDGLTITEKVTGPIERYVDPGGSVG